MKEGEEYSDGWAGVTKADLKEMYNTNSAQYPEWIRCKSGGNFDAKATLKANGLHPDRIPEILKEYSPSCNILKEIEEQIPLIYIPTPEK